MPIEPSGIIARKSTSADPRHVDLGNAGFYPSKEYEMVTHSLRQRGTAIVLRHGRVLLVRDKGKHRFSLPGGGIKKGEPTVSAAARELYEELGLKAINIRRLRECDFRGSVSKHRVCLVTEVGGKPHLKGHELDRFIWWDQKKSIPLYAHVTQILSKLPRVEQVEQTTSGQAPHCP